MAPSDCSNPSNIELDGRRIGRVRRSRCLLEGLVAAVEFEAPAILDLAVCEGTFGRPVSFVLGQVVINKEHQLDVIIPIKGETDAAIALALGLLKQVV